MQLVTLQEETFKELQSFLVEEAGLYFAKDRSRLLEEKLSERIKACNRKNFEEYFHYIKFHPEGRLELKSLLDLITIGETYFFRNEAQFNVLKDYVLPELIKNGKDINIWCAGCSTAEEPYSIAMILKEFLPCFEEYNISILATDINRQSLKKAKEGVYGERAVHATPLNYIEKYFHKEGSKYFLNDEIKKMINFEYHNLARDPFTLRGMQEVDIIFCRNVVIYFDLETIKRIVSQFTECLKGGSFYFIGHAETLWGISDVFMPIEFPHTFIYQKLKEPAKKVILPPHIPIPKVEEIIEVKPIIKEEKKKEEPALDALMIEGTQLANEGKYEDAIKVLEKIVEKDNLWTRAYYLLGILYEKLGKYERAIEEFRRVLYIEDKLPIGYFYLGNLYKFLGEKGEAKKEYLNCIKVLKNKEEDSPIEYGEGLTSGILYQAANRALESL